MTTNDFSVSALMVRPFQRIAGWSALAIGLGVMFLTAAIAAPCGTNFATSLNIHFGKPTPFWLIFLLILIGWITVSVVFLIAGKIVSKSKVCAVDVFGYLAMARGPFLLAAPIGLLPIMQNLFSPIALVAIVFCIFIDIWIVLLSYNAFAVSTNIRHKGGFALLFIFSEIVGIFLSLLPLILRMPQEPPSEAALASIQVLEYPVPESDDAALERFEMARKTLLGLVEGKYAEIPIDFNAEMKVALPVFSLKTTWWSLVLINGPFQKTVPPVLVDEVEGYHRVKIPFQFQRGEKGILLIAFDKDNKIAGWFILPMERNTTPGWSGT